MRPFIAAALCLALLGATSACVDPSAHIASSLEGYGFAPDQSTWVGERLEKNPSLGQLQQLGRAARAARDGDTTFGRLTADDFVRVAGQVKDPNVPIEVARAATGCGIVTAPPAL